MFVDSHAHQEYERRHRPIWKEFEEVLKNHGVSNYSIFLDAEKSELFGYAEIENEEEWASIAAEPICQKWWAFMSPIMLSNPDHSPISRELREVFHMD